jgi:hypothetical protein
MLPIKKPLLLVLMIFFSLSGYGQKEKKEGIFRDTLDGKFDASSWLADYHGFLPVIMPITEPAVNYGIGAGLIFLHRNKKYPKQPPGMSAIGGGYTFNNSWMLFLFHRNHYLNDRIRYTGALGYADVNLNFYRKILDRELRANMNLNAPLLFQQLMFRIPKTRLFLGGFFLTSNLESKFNETNLGDVFQGWSRTFKTGSLTAKTFWDSRDNTFTPNKGIYAIAEYGFHENWLGSEVVYKAANFRAYMYGHWLAKVVFGLRVQTDNVIGDDVPYFAKPFLSMRGMPAMRYQGSNTLLFETEERWDFNPRWSMVGFVGTGKAMEGYNELNFDDWKWAGGAGIRYLMARWFKFYGGFDLAAGEEGFAFYVTVGSNWGR